ncbi:MAG: lamin tail domain-containing protein [Myxococcales bacterium]|nr:lamin tail domain-containing protein [Myxococcales bacterium]MCB9531937.1 lamin tail domain-containing protein [Myxococcales bacterium]MCB9533905.1 lamin tail domain-containing protein [Myxococcales bacterium]
MRRLSVALVLALSGSCSDSPANGDDADTERPLRDTGAGDVGSDGDAATTDARVDVDDSGADDADASDPSDTRDGDDDTQDGGEDGDDGGGGDTSGVGDADASPEVDVTPDVAPDAAPDATPCTDLCTAGETTCDGDQVVRCVDADRDGCVEPTVFTTCREDQRCRAGACVGATAQVVISEIWYDTPGGDNQCFVELHGPAGLSLSGWSLVGINGSNGAEYATIALTGSIGSDGLFVVADTSASGEVGAAADQRSADADFQNGPDSVQLVFDGTVVDAIGYGTFGRGDTFAGEGSSATPPSDTASLARDVDYTDTDNNRADFSAHQPPTPGAPNEHVNRAPTAGIDGGGTYPLGSTVTLDAGASVDPDGDGLTFTWSLTVPGGSGVSLSSTTTEVVRFTPDRLGTYVARVGVADPDGASATTSVDVVVIEAPNIPPTAAAGDDVVMLPDDIVVLDASGSTDVDGTIVDYLWELTSSPTGAVYELVDDTTAELWFTATTTGDYLIRLTVTDDEGARATDSVRISVRDEVTATAYVINEIHIDTPGGDTQTFVELCGPVGGSLSGYTLVGVNGSTGRDYNTITLNGAFGVDGLYLIADTDASFRGDADVVSGLVDYQNGPDSIQLRHGSEVIDAIAYGSFGSGDRRAGEGTPVLLPTDLDQSLQRAAGCVDTNNNRADFTAADPTPRAPRPR